MKNTLFFFCALFLTAHPSLTAQVSDNLSSPIPFYPNVKTGKLSNGLTYYILKNAKPEKRCELRLVVNIGSLAEKDDQQGLAHFLEHLCFNGTKNFKKSELVDYLESIGTKFGAHLNASTSFDQTIYKLQIPTDKPVVFEKGFQILEDWAHNVSFEDVEIDKERGVVISERRNGLGGMRRMFDKTFPIRMFGSRYAERLPIGQLEVLEKCPYATIRQFYNDWYRPDLMAVMAVGDFDVAQVEKIIQSKFNNLTNPSNERPRQSYDVPDHDDLKIAIATDKESSFNSVGIAYKHPTSDAKNLNDVRSSMINMLVNTMLNSRFEELRQQADPPFNSSSVFYSGMVRTKNAFNVSLNISEKGFERGISTMITELERAKRFGFVATELERVKKMWLRNYESASNERGNEEDSELINQLVDVFLENAPFTDATFDYEFAKKQLPSISLEEVNAKLKSWITNGKNSVITIQGIDKQGVTIPSELEVRDFIAQARASKIEPYQDKTIDRPLLKDRPKEHIFDAFKEITLVPENKATGQKALVAQQYGFPNGAKVVMLHTDFKNDELMFQAYSFGGSSNFSLEDRMSGSYATSIIRESGLGDFSKNDLKKYLNDKQANVSPYIGENVEGLNGYCSPRDFETLLQLIYLHITAPRKDEVAFSGLMKQQKSYLENKSVSPELVYRDSVNYILADHHPRRKPFGAKELEQVNLDKAIELYKERFHDGGDFTFFFVGNLTNLDNVAGNLATYIGGLPNDPKGDYFKDLNIQTPKGTVKTIVKKGVTQKSQVQIFYTGDVKYNRQNRNELAALTEILKIKLRESLREDKGGVYGVGISSSLNHFPTSSYSVNINFSCAPERVEELTIAVQAEIEKVKQNGAEEKDITKVRETRRVEMETTRKENNFWLQNLVSIYQNGEEDTTLKALESVEKLNVYFNALTSKDYKRLANQYFDLKNVATVVLLPE